MSAADLRLDHVTVAGPNLRALETALTALGFTVEHGGPHNNHATEMSVASFPDGTYLELIAAQPHADPTALAAHPWGKLITGNGGPAAWAVRPKNFEAEVERLRTAGVPVKLQDGGRQRPDGTDLRWQTAQLGTGGMGDFFPFLIRDTPPRDKRAYPTGKAANRNESGILRVVIAVNKIADAVDRFHLAYPDTGRPLKVVDPKFGAELAWFTDTPLIFAAPLGSSSWLSDRLATFGEGPCAILLSSKKRWKGDAAVESRWFGRDIKWFDPQKLGWWLGIQDEGS